MITPLFFFVCLFFVVVVVFFLLFFFSHLKYCLTSSLPQST